MTKATDNILIQIAQDPALPEFLRLVNRWRALPSSPSLPSDEPFTLRPALTPIRIYLWSQENPVAAKVVLAAGVITLTAGIAYLGHLVGKRAR